MISVSLATNTLNIPNTWVNLQNVKTRREAGLRLLKIQVLAKKNFRKMSKRYHPDNIRTGNRIKFELVKESYDLIKTLTIINNQQRSFRGVGITITADGINMYSNKNSWGFSA